MNNYMVGASILSVITESLYDNPIVVFREYVQNSVDSILKSSQNSSRNPDDYEIKIGMDKDNLYFLDNAQGIETDDFFDEMVKIGASSKKRQENFGYKGIGRLSGVPYGKKLKFINIKDFKSGTAQKYTIDGERYNEIKDNEEYSGMSFKDLMKEIGKNEIINLYSQSGILNVIKKYEDILSSTNTGFIVVIENISSVLKNTISDDNFILNLQWLLPVDFEQDLYKSEKGELFSDLGSLKKDGTTCIKSFKIFYNDNQIFRPIKDSMLRYYVCKTNFLNFAVGFHTFKNDKISIDRNNKFSGIKIYIDNMLLCDENELMRNLDNYGLLSHTLNGQIQSVRGMGAMIYITDKVNITANARRTFIEVTDNDSLTFLKLLAEFVNTIYDTRYALSNYFSAKSNYEKGSQKVKTLENAALKCLQKLTSENVQLISEPEELPFNKLTVPQKKRVIKKNISEHFDLKLKEYLETNELTSPETAWEDFLIWLTSNDKFIN